MHESKVKEFIEGLNFNMKRMFGEKPTGSDDMGKMINEFHTKRVQRLIETSGGTIVGGGKVDVEAKYIEPTIILNPALDSELMVDEIFGPVLPIIPYKKFDEVLEFVNKKEKPLAIYYFGNEKSENCKSMMQETRSGAFVTNEACM